MGIFFSKQGKVENMLTQMYELMVEIKRDRKKFCSIVKTDGYNSAATESIIYQYKTKMNRITSLSDEIEQTPSYSNVVVKDQRLNNFYGRVNNYIQRQQSFLRTLTCDYNQLYPQQD